jgi:hypothetical protein
LYLTLRKWRIGQRQSKLVSLDDFKAALRAVLPRMEQLERVAINGTGLPADLTGQVWQLVYSLGVVENNTKVVAGTKTLHPLLPNLVPPMDRDYTRAFFGFPNPALGDYRQPGVFRDMYDHLAVVARQVRPEGYVTGSGWRTSRTKILDNAVVAFWCIESGKIKPASDDASGGESANKISFNVPGLPPAKDGGTSIFNARHTHLSRVRVLLDAARGCGRNTRLHTRRVRPRPTKFSCTDGIRYCNDGTLRPGVSRPTVPRPVPHRSLQRQPYRYCA